ncbi:uncharacterized protein LOC141614375 [Silene latifolia]|uniref:uncharacterized protein LOC141614375 n=1 Tax=Silene latifolia TaxID=37657 RepID=UPI003D770452
MVSVFMQVPQMFRQLMVALSVALLGYGYKALKPPPPKKCGSAGGSPVNSPRIRLADGRHLAYRESGVAKDEARYKIIVIHGFNSCKDQPLPLSQELVEELKLYMLFFDRAGYGESDPHPRRSVKSEAYDIQELADALQLGSKFYVIGISIGGYAAWSCIRYIPQRLAGISLVVPFVHYWWPHFPSELSREAWRKLPVSDRWTFRVAHYTPWLLYWWMNQKLFPSLKILSDIATVFTQQDLEINEKRVEVPNEKIRQQGVYESLHRDMMASFANWEFSPLDLRNPFPKNEGSVHIWQGHEDKIIPSKVNRFISEKLEWIKYHEIIEGGHMFIYEQSMCETVVRALVLG